MATKENDPVLDDFTDSVPRAKRDIVLRFIREQETLQTSQVNLKVVDDETLDLIDSAFVAKGEDTNRTSIDDSTTSDKILPRPLSQQISNLSLEAEKSSNIPRSIIAPRPPSGRPRTRSSGSRKRSKNIYRQSSVDNLVHSHEKNPPKYQGNECYHDNTRESIPLEYRERKEFSSSPNADESGSEGNLNASWPQQCLSRKLFDPLRKYSGFLSAQDTPCYYQSPVESFSEICDPYEVLRPQSSQSFQRVRPAEILTARISSASECDRITCDATSLTKPSSYTRKLNKGSRRRTYINFNRLDAQISLEGPLELEQVHPSEIPLYRSSSAASSSAPYALVHVPPIGREGPAPSSS